MRRADVFTDNMGTDRDTWIDLVFYTLLRVHRHKGDAVPVSNLLHFVFSSDMVVISIIMILVRITA